MVWFSIKETHRDIYTQYINLHTHNYAIRQPATTYNKFDSPKIRSVISSIILESILFFSVWLRCPKLLATWNKIKSIEKIFHEEIIGTWHPAVITKGESKYIYPRIALNGQPISAPAAVAITATCKKRMALVIKQCCNTIR